MKNEMRAEQPADSACSFECEALEYEQVTNDEEIAFFTSFVRETGGPALDMGCGTGRLSFPIAESGIEVVGLDISQKILEVFRRKLSDVPLFVRNRVHLVCGDMRRFALRRDFSCAVCSSNTMLLLGSEGAMAESFACVAKHLRREGVLLLDVASLDEEMIAALGCDYGEVPDIALNGPGGARLQRTHRAKRLSSPEGAGKLSVTYRYFGGAGSRYGERSEELALVRPHRVLALIESSGFRVQQTFGWYDRRPYIESERKLLVIAKKRSKP
jgi:SAM-dependent methyltransferase